MLVEELLEKLSKMPKSARVVFMSVDGDGVISDDVESVEYTRGDVLIELDHQCYDEGSFDV